MMPIKATFQAVFIITTITSAVLGMIGHDLWTIFFLGANTIIGTGLYCHIWAIIYDRKKRREGHL